MSVTNLSPSTTTVFGPRTTPFGAVEHPRLLLNLPNKVVLRVDHLTSLKEIWGEDILTSRQQLYALVAGTISDSGYQDLISSYYVQYSAFANYVDEKYFFEDQSLPLLSRIIEPARSVIQDYAERVEQVCRRYGGKLLGTHQDYSYYVFPSETLPELEGSERIC